MKKLYLILLLSAAFIAPECCAMKRVPNFLKKVVQSEVSGVKKWNYFVKSGLVLVGCTTYTVINGSDSFDVGRKKGESGFFECNDKKIEFTGPIIKASLMTLFAESVIASAGGPLLVYSAFQGACYSAGYCKYKYDQKKKLETFKKD